jgi:hypothetical protein
VEVKGRRRGGARSIEIRVMGGSEQPAGPARDVVVQVSAYPPAGGSLRVMLARLLLGMQGAMLSVWDDDDGGLWATSIVFPPRG